MIIRILGSAAGGGLPQWNCGCRNCRRVRSGSPWIRARTQSSVAISADGEHWYLLNVSPDIRQQLAAFPPLAPPPGQLRGTPIAGCLLTDAELDHTAGLLLLREGETFPLFATAAVQNWLQRDFPVGPLLSRCCERPWMRLIPDVPCELPVVTCSTPGTEHRSPPPELHVRPFEVSRVGPRYAPAESATQEGAVIGLEIHQPSRDRTLLYVPALPTHSERLEQAVTNADVLLMDGTFWSDDELSRAGISSRTARQMGHWPVGGMDGSLAWLARLPIPHRVYLHINNTNPLLSTDTPEYQQVRQSGIQIGTDGDTFSI